MTNDPNTDRNDPMMPEYWQLGEDLQDRIRAAGYDAPSVEGIAVDVHDLLQASARIEQILIPEIIGHFDMKDQAKLIEMLDGLKQEFDHIGWHCKAASDYLTAATQAIK